MAKTTDAIEILRKRFGYDKEFDLMVAEESVNCRVAMMVYQARNDAGLTQQELADLVGTTQQVISRLEDADYDGHSLSMLQRIADALNSRLEIQMIPKGEPQHA